MVCAALYDLMKPEIDATIQEKILQGIKSLITTVKCLGSTKEMATEIVVKEYNKSEEEAKELVEKYW